MHSWICLLATFLVHCGLHTPPSLPSPTRQISYPSQSIMILTLLQSLHWNIKILQHENGHRGLQADPNIARLNNWLKFLNWYSSSNFISVTQMQLQSVPYVAHTSFSKTEIYRQRWPRRPWRLKQIIRFPPSDPEPSAHDEFRCVLSSAYSTRTRLMYCRQLIVRPCIYFRPELLEISATAVALSRRAMQTT
jgi:hypothetical protein